MSRRVRAAWCLGALTALVLSTSTVLARADAILPPPKCPPGARGTASHAGAWCEPATCDASTPTCKDGATCRAWRVCTRTSLVEPRLRMPGSRERIPIEVVVGTCAPGAGCTGNEARPPPTAGELQPGDPVCKETSYCVAAPPEPPPAAPSAQPPATGTTTSGASRGGCGCEAAGASDSTLPLAFSALTLLAWRRWRGRRPPAGPAILPLP